MSSPSGDDLTKVIKPGESKPARRMLGAFELIRPLGEGGMGTVYLARDPALDRNVAIKVVRPEIVANERFIARFMREAKICAALNHPNIVSTYAVGTHEGAPYLVLELVDGHTLRELLQTPPPLPLDRIIEIIMQVCDGLEAAALRRIVHRDIKPANIMVRRDGLVKVMDFGLSREVHTDKITMTSAILGTPDYMAPEQATGREVDFRVDLYALGITLFQCVTGYLPYRSSSAYETIRMHAEAALPEDPRLAGIADGRLLALIERLTAKNPADRPSNHKDVKRELEWIRQRLLATGTVALPAGNAAAGRLEWQRPGDGTRTPITSDILPQIIVPATPAGPTPRSPVSSRAARTRRRQGVALVMVGAALLAAVAGVGTWMAGGFDGPARRPGLAAPPTTPPATQSAPAPTQAAPRRHGIADGPFDLTTTPGQLMSMQDLLAQLGHKGLNHLVTEPKSVSDVRGVASFRRRQLVDVLAVATLANGWAVEQKGEMYWIRPGAVPPDKRLATFNATLRDDELPLVSLTNHSDARISLRTLLAVLSREQGIDYLVIGDSLPDAEVPSVSLTRQPISVLMGALGTTQRFTWTWSRGTLVMIESP